MTVRRRAPLVLGVVAAIVLWLLAWGLAERCTTDNSCTLERCPARCDRPEQILIAALAVLALVTADGILGRWGTRPVVIAQVMVVLVAGVLMLAAT